MSCINRSVSYNWLRTVYVVTMDSEKHVEFLNYFLNKDKKYPERIYNLSPKKRENEKANFRKIVKPFSVKNGTLYHGDVEAVTKDRVPGMLLACHDNPATGGHYGRDKTYQKIQARYWCKGMKTRSKNTSKTVTSVSNINQSC